MQEGLYHDDFDWHPHPLEKENAALRARVARLEEFAKKAGLAFDDIGAVNWSRRARRVLEEK